MSRQLPSQPSLRHLKNEAKALHKALDRGDVGIAGRIAANLPRLSGATETQVRAAEVSLQEVQHVLAKEYGFAGWADLAASVEPDFESLVQLSDQDIRNLQWAITFQRSVSQRDIVAALKHADAGPGSTRQRLLFGLSDRFRWSILQEMESLDVTGAQAREAQARLLAQVRLLGQAGRISWPPGNQAVPAQAPPRPALPAGLEAVGRPLEQLSIDEVRQICHGISRMVQAHGPSAYSIGPGAFYRELEAVGWQASPSVREALNLAADGAGPEVIRRFMRNRGDTVVRNLEIRMRVMLEGVVAIRNGEDPRLIAHRLDTVCYTGYETQYREPEGTVEQFRSRMAQAPVSRLRHDELAMAIVDLAWIAQRRGVAALREVVDAIDDEHLRAGVQMVIDQVDPAKLAEELEICIAPALRRVRDPFAALGEGLAAALEGKIGATLDEAVGAALARG